MSNTNKKIIGATSVEYAGIKFKSRLECSCFKKLESSGLRFSYEGERIILWKGLKLNNVTLYSPKKLKAGKYNKILEKQTRALLNITYTPDFIVWKNDYIIYFDVKGKENDTYPIKKKMFLKYLEERNNGNKYIFIEPHSVRQMLQAIDFINTL